jgi:hypothetical protein
MASIENPAEWIVQTLPQEGFESEIEVFPGGITNPDLPLEKDERVYGGYQKNMYFSPEAIFIPLDDTIRRIPWNTIKDLTGDLAEKKLTWKFKTKDRKSYLYHFQSKDVPDSLGTVIAEMVRQSRWKRGGMMPTPTHLRKCLRRPDVPISEIRGKLTAPVVCPCGSAEMELLYPGQTHEYTGRVIPCVAEIKGKFFFRLEARCKACQKTHLLLDKDFHGWNGFVCHDKKQATLPRPALKPWHCLSCKGNWHQMTVTICTEGKEDFIDETDGEFPAKRWPDGFGWFTLSTHCIKCGLDTEGLVDYETM